MADKKRKKRRDFILDRIVRKNPSYIQEYMDREDRSRDVLDRLGLKGKKRKIGSIEVEPYADLFGDRKELGFRGRFSSGGLINPRGSGKAIRTKGTKYV